MPLLLGFVIRYLDTQGEKKFSNEMLICLFRECLLSIRKTFRFKVVGGLELVEVGNPTCLEINFSRKKTPKLICILEVAFSSHIK